MGKRKNIIVAIVVGLILGGFIFWRKVPANKPVSVSENSEKAVAENAGGENMAEITVPQTNQPDTNQANQEVPKEAKNQSTDKQADSGNSEKQLKPADAQNKLEIQDQLVSWGFRKATGRRIDTIIIHSSYNNLGGDPFDVSKIIEEYKSYGVSPHYLIDREGKIYRFVEDKNIAYHAGASSVPDGRNDVNNFSLGIEMVNTKTDKLTDAQYAALNNLLAYLKNKYRIKYVLGHDQIAPGRKDDPWNLDWGRIK